jgi:uncharacterized protein
MNNSDVFLSAEWRHLAMMNFEVDPAILKPLVPAGTELDNWQGRTFISLVGFMFLRTRVMGIPIPFHTNFEEVNLRFYIKRDHPEGIRRGVVFIKEIVPRWGIAFLGRKLYNENYISLPMRHEIKQVNCDVAVQYDWHLNARWHSLGVIRKGDPFLPPDGSQAEFITEHYWGYAAQVDGGCIEYQVEHPKWRIWNADDFIFDIDVKDVYGDRFVPFLEKRPVSSFLAEGSAIKVSKGKRVVN